MPSAIVSDSNFLASIYRAQRDELADHIAVIQDEVAVGVVIVILVAQRSEAENDGVALPIPTERMGGVIGVCTEDGDGDDRGDFDDRARGDVFFGDHPAPLAWDVSDANHRS